MWFGILGMKFEEGVYCEVEYITCSIDYCSKNV